MRNLKPISAFVCVAALTACVPSSEHEAALTRLRVLESQQASDATKLAEAEWNLQESQAMLARITRSSAFELWEVTTEDAAPNVRLRRLKEIGDKYPNSDVSIVANLEAMRIANKEWKIASELSRSGNFDEAVAAISALSHGASAEVIDFVTKCLGQIAQLKDMARPARTASSTLNLGILNSTPIEYVKSATSDNQEAKSAAERSRFIQRFIGGTAAFHEVVSNIRRETLDQVVEILGKADRVEKTRELTMITYSRGVHNRHKKDTDKLEVIFENKSYQVLRIQAENNLPYEDSDLRRSINAVGYDKFSR